MSCCNTTTVNPDECARIHFDVNNTVVNDFKIYDQVYACVCVGICVDGHVCMDMCIYVCLRVSMYMCGW